MPFKTMTYSFTKNKQIVNILYIISIAMGLLYFISVIFFDMSIHSWKVVQLTAGIASGLLLVLVTVATYRIYILEKAEKDQSSKKTAMSGALVPPKSIELKAKDSIVAPSKDTIDSIKTALRDRNDTPQERKILFQQLLDAVKKETQNLIDSTETVKNLFGSNPIVIDKKILESGYPYNPGSAFGVEVPLVIRLVDNKIRIDCTLISIDEKIVAKIVDNNWKINPNNYFERNYDSNGFEVIDGEGIIKLQIDFINNDSLEVNGFFKSQQEYILATPTVIRFFRSNLKSKSYEWPVHYCQIYSLLVIHILAKG